MKIILIVCAIALVLLGLGLAHATAARKRRIERESINRRLLDKERTCDEREGHP